MCFCGKSEDFKMCCGRYIDGNESPSTPELMMRSRYSAFVLKNMDYLKRTHDPQNRDQWDKETNKEWAESVEFQGLEILKTEDAGTKGFVEFKATFKDLKTQQVQVHHELSRFRKHQGTWYFKEGKIKQST